MKKFQLTKQTGILIVAIALAIILVCLLLFLPGKGDSAGVSDARFLLSTNSVVAEKNLALDNTATLAKSVAATAKQKAADVATLAEAETAAQEANAASGSNSNSNSKNSSGSTKKSDSKETGPTITITIDCKTVLSNMDKLDKDKVSYVPSSGIIFSKKVTFKDGEYLMDILKRATKNPNVYLLTGFGDRYITSVGQIGELDCGSLSGWLYSVNGTFPGYSAAQYKVKDGDKVAIRYTCDLGKDIGAGGVTQD